MTADTSLLALRAPFSTLLHFYIIDGSLVPKRALNLLSINQLGDYDCIVSFIATYCFIHDRGLKFQFRPPSWRSDFCSFGSFSPSFNGFDLESI